jgi:DNA uptake protein ComE-like DNA-binding protein
MPRAGDAVLAVALAAVLVLPACALLRREHEPVKPAPIDLNAAALRKVEKLPGVTPSMARRIVEGRPYDEPHDLVSRGILTEREFERIADLVIVKRGGG